MSVDAQNSKANARSRPVEPVEINRIFNSTNPDSPVKPSPAEHIGSPTTPPSKADSTPSPKAVSPAFKRLSNSNRTKSTSFSFPVQPTQFTNPYQSQPLEPASDQRSAPIPKPIASVTPETNILTALAAQERRVLEIKETLVAAEEELKRLKKQWATQESSKKRNDVRRVHHMRPLSVSVVKTQGGADDLDGSSTWLYEEMERRKALLKNSKSSRRRVFPGSRHTRTLSLLSSDKTNGTTTPATDSEGTKLDSNPARRSRLSMSPELPTLEDEDPTGVESSSDRQPQTPPRDAFVRTSKQMATDLREGLWTFLEDLRQAATGEEARQAAPPSAGGPSRQNSQARLPRRPRLAGDNSSNTGVGAVGGDNTPGLEENPSSIPERPLKKFIKPSRLSTSIPKPKTRTVTDQNNESWETWSSPPPLKDAATDQKAQSPSRSRKNSESKPISPIKVTKTRTNSISMSPSKLPAALSVNTTTAMEPPPSANRLSRIPRLSSADQRALSSSAVSPSKSEVDKRRDSMLPPPSTPRSGVSPGLQGRRATSYFSNDWDKSVTSETMPEETLL